jgi:hypothetical protein
MTKLKIFISYSWDSQEHRQWVHHLADDLERFAEFHVTWDGYDLDALVDKNHFMESGISQSDFVLIVTTRNYKKKADERSGGVGIETFLATAMHWGELLRTKKSNVIVLRREVDSIPQYLAGHFHIDFSDDDDFEKSLNQLIDLLSGRGRASRPAKLFSLDKDNRKYVFTHVEDIIRIAHKNRKALVVGSDGTIARDGLRVKYELWETRSPSLGYFLALFNNINIQQTIEKAVGSLHGLGIRPPNLTVLRPRPSRPESEIVRNALRDAGFNTVVHEFTYKEYIWDFCIDDDLKSIAPPEVIANYTHQVLELVSGESDRESQTSAVEFLVETLQKNSRAAAHLVVAPGGMGKTSLCFSVAAQLHNRKDLRSSVILIQAEEIQKHFVSDGVLATRIESVYHLYELFAKYNLHERIFDKATFDLAVLCGNLVVIVDGLDELASSLQDRFNLNAFLASISELHDQLGSSNVLLTTRNSLLIDDKRLAELDIPKYELLGFDTASCEKYLARRFRDYTSREQLTQRVLAQIQKINLAEADERIVPFFADIVATIAEDQLQKNLSQDFELKCDPTPYASNNELTDHIIYSVLRREETRHDLDISTSEVLQLLTGLVVDFGKRWPAEELLHRLRLLYDERSTSVFSKLALNPLLLRRPDEFELRYSFLQSYFEVLFILDGILEEGIQPELIKCLARLGSFESPAFREVKKYFLGRRDEFHERLKSIIPKLRDIALSPSTDENKAAREMAKKAIAALLGLYGAVRDVAGEKLSPYIWDVLGCASLSGSQRTVRGLFLRGDFPALDFSNCLVTNSRLQNYQRLLHSKFDNTNFMYTVFQGCGNGGEGATTLERDMFDPTCDVGDLVELLTYRALDNRPDERRLLESEAKKFLGSFFKGGRFETARLSHIKFSNRIAGLTAQRLDFLVVNNRIHGVDSRRDEPEYEIAETFRKSVRKYLADNYADAEMRSFLRSIRNYQDG